MLPRIFLVRLLSLTNFMRLSEKKRSHYARAVIGARNSRSLHYGRDDNSATPATREPGHTPTQRQNCHPDRSAAKWRDLLFLPSH
jgi:hypothetical protein